MFSFSRLVLRALVVGTALACAPPALALPLLQLEIGGGVYDTETETTVATSQQFTLYAYLTPGSSASPGEISSLLSKTYYIAAALSPQVGPTHVDYGSFSFNSQTVQASSDMVYGRPPLETYLGGTAGGDSGDLATHGVYDTFFKEFSFQFNPSQRATPYNVQDDTGIGPTPDPSGGMYYMAFQVDTTSLWQGTSVHFDLYSTKKKSGGDMDIDKFAPFSHDAESMPGGTVPEPTSLVLLGSGLAGLIARQRRARARRSAHR